MSKSMTVQNYNKKHDSVKINATHFITYKIKKRTMKEESLKNLRGKTASGYLSERSKRLIENTVFNYLYAQLDSKKEKRVE